MGSYNFTPFKLSPTVRKAIFIFAAAICLMPFMSPPLALLLGLILAQTIEHPFLHLNHQVTNLLLKISVVGLGFGMNIFSAMRAGEEGLMFTVVSIVSVLASGALLGRLMKIEKKTSFLISAGTAICGGSAIAALSPVVKAGEKQISIALGTIFILNSIALFAFPAIGHFFHLTQNQFGLWCAIAIHDTSSVVGAACKYGTAALEVATTVKLTRALWIIPVAFATAYLFKDRDAKIKIPYFIGLFIAAMLVNTYVPFIRPATPYLVGIAKAGLTLTLFLIGTGLSFSTIKSVGVKPLLEGLLLWLLISATALWAVITLA
ncbi:putative integral membrane protein (TIGR00698 family) [Arcticibacter tournemirensis]|uniref:Putative sulfate exporter family transporter n=1 Tax=Arcticibacter tournemirensis TaxID=699437 RepID=A0A5M9HAH5_9SPHI|nr:putative sulfate exporter family transporter [Arcticibacter tournemirensis]KAA8483379.1 putative sulfate exporter family transporter [Arcticibacter tournemirensis]TQM50930.1 putative integral membrane protein (TIGR00698 family) [Arcticibacter tournemirensis]